MGKVELGPGDPRLEEEGRWEVTAESGSPEQGHPSSPPHMV